VNVGTLGRENLRRVSHLHRDAVPGWSARPRLWRRSPVVIVASLIGLGALGLRLAYGATGPTDTVGAQLVVGSSRFDVTHGAPAAPGSWLYVAAGHVLHLATGLSTVHSLVLLAALASGGAASFTCLAGSALGGRWVGVAAGAFLATAPLSWFAGSTVSVSGFGALAGATLIVLARRARPYGPHGVVAIALLGLAGGIHLSVAFDFVFLALVVVVASVRTVGQLLATAVVGLASVAAWLVPVIAIQPGGFHAWFHALHVQLSEAAAASSPLAAPSSGALTNLGVAGGWSLLTLGPALVVAVIGVLLLTAARIVTRRPAGTAAPIWGAPAEKQARLEWPWYQTSAAVLAAALLPPVVFALLGQYAVAGGVLAYVVPATILLLLPMGRLLRHRSRGLRRAATAIFSVAVVAACVVNVQRFVAAPGILPASFARHHPGLWISEARYQSPYPATAATIRSADLLDSQVGRLRSVVDPASDLVVCVGPSSATLYRTIDALAPDLRVALVDPYRSVDPFRSVEHGGLLERTPPGALEVGPGGHALVLAPASSVPFLRALQARHRAQPTALEIGGFPLWRVSPGGRLFGLPVVAVSGGLVP
jgi:hypothetical protein